MLMSIIHDLIKRPLLPPSSSLSFLKAFFRELAELFWPCVKHGRLLFLHSQNIPFTCKHTPLVPLIFPLYCVSLRLCTSHYTHSFYKQPSQPRLFPQMKISIEPQLHSVECRRNFDVQLLTSTAHLLFIPPLLSRSPCIMKLLARCDKGGCFFSFFLFLMCSKILITHEICVRLKWLPLQPLQWVPLLFHAGTQSS